MKVGICQSCGGIATQTCQVCGSTVCVKCKTAAGCKICGGIKKIK